MFKYRLPSRTNLFRKSLEYELRQIRRQITESKDEGFRGLAARAMRAFRDFISTLGQPRYKFRKIHLDNNFASRQYYNETRETIQADLIAAEEDVTNLGNASIESFNVAQMLAKELESLAAQVGSKTKDIAIVTDQERTASVLVAGDDFATKNLINSTYPLSMSQAFVDTRQGLVSLARIESIPIFDPSNIDIQVKPTTPGIDDKPESYRNNLGRFYEGRFYALEGQAEPEGGKWHLEELTSAPPDNGYYYNYEEWYYKNGAIWKSESSTGTGLNAYEYAGDPESVNPIGAYVDDDGNIVIKNEIIIRDRGATEAEKIEIRKRMVDGNPDTYWQCEYVFRPASFGTTPGQVRGRVYTNKEGKEKTEGPTTSTPTYITDLRGTFTQSGGENDARLSVTPDDLRAAAITYDNLDMEISITITLPNPVRINWLNLLPMNFGETAWLRVTDIEYAERRNGQWKQIPNFSNGRSQNILTEDVNAELTTATAEEILSPSRYTYRGSGVWAFPTREVQALRFRLRQDVPTPVLYQKIQVQMHRIWERQKVHTYDSDSRSLRSEKNKTKEWTRVITLDYLKSVQIMQGSLSADDVAPTTDDGSEQNYSTADHSKPKNEALNTLSFGLFGGGHNRRSSDSENEHDSGFYMKGYWVETFYDLIGYRIGIRELAAYRNIYETNSELVSTPFYSPVDIEKVALRVDDDVPSGTSILYYVSPDDGKTWHEINPLDKPSKYGENGYAVPKTISFNLPGNPENEAKYVTTETAVKKLLVKAELKSEADTTSPILKSYRLFMYPAQALISRGYET